MSTGSMETGSLGFPRMGRHRELKFAVERFWFGEWSSEHLAAAERESRRSGWQMQAAAGIHHVPSNEFSLYDHVLDTAALVGAIPARCGRTSLARRIAASRSGLAK